MRKFTNNKWNLFLLATALMTSSCHQEDALPGAPGAGDEGETQAVTIKINFPFEETGSSLRSIGGAEENAIQTVDVLAFRVDGEKAYFDYSVAGEKISDDAISAVLWTRSYPQRLVLITNARAQIEQLLRPESLPSGWRGVEQEAMLAGLEFSLTEGAKWQAINAANYTAFPMWGESEAVTITKRTPQGAYSIRLIRMVAKINVQLDKSVSGLTGKFKIKNVRLYNTYTKGRIAPGEVENGKVTQATVPDGAERYLGPLEYDDFSVPGEPDVAVRGSIYTFETPAAVRASEATCLVIGGIYMNDTKETYYRIDFLDEDGEYASILRNHQYTVNINNVTGSGYDTPEEAFE
ncbi:MAG: FimB/Mfa2 family fimbrial subunit, partial [Dysgonamonadaceae bacterium]|nr:FimB/Mfa2 family fimbrial subunit [Dysgonamonadaceae bacterium]